jgi:hypothetical protein
LYSNYEKSGPEKLAREVNLRPVRQTDPGKLAREADLPSARNNALVLDQKEPGDDVLAIRQAIRHAHYGNTLKAPLAANPPPFPWFEKRAPRLTGRRPVATTFMKSL